MGQEKPEQLFKPDLHTFQKIRWTVFSGIISLFLAAIFNSCANRAPVTGGEKDTIPPIMISSNPADQSLNFDDTEITLIFDERIQAQQLKRKLLITPFTETQYKVKAVKNTLVVSFEEPFDDSTTYSLNFADAIADVTENNPAKNVSIAFSTWGKIDSLFMYGKVVDLYTNKPIEGAAISVYQANDTLDIFTGKPYYFAFTDEYGAFRIQNMKSGHYRLYSFNDANGNFLLESKDEAHGFLRDTFDVSSFQDSIVFKLVKQDVQELKLVNRRSNGSHFDVRVNKLIHEYELVPIDSGSKTYPSNIVNDNDVIRFYNTDLSEGDSIGYYLTIKDLVGNELIDTTYIKFTNRQIRTDELSMSASPGNNAGIVDSLNVTFKFNKPIKSFNPDSLLIKYDTLRTDRVDSVATVTWNWNRTEFQFQSLLDKQFLQTEGPLVKAQREADRLRIDSLITIGELDSTSRLQPLKEEQIINPNQVFLYIGDAAFISLEDDSSQFQLNKYVFKNPENYGIVSGTISASDKSFTIQLINKEFAVIKKSKNQNNYRFNYVPAGSYKIRVMLDANNDGEWSAGNLKEGIEPEPVLFTPQFFELRENWEVNNIDLNLDSLVHNE
ncbi:MAG: Ig-like domain-containing domain [Cyclobacteriaceae bacterium]